MKDRKGQRSRQQQAAAQGSKKGHPQGPPCPDGTGAAQPKNLSPCNKKGNSQSALPQQQAASSPDQTSQARPSSEGDSETPILPEMVTATESRTPDADKAGEGVPQTPPPPRAADKVLQHSFWLETNEPARSISIPPWVLELVDEANEILVLAQLNYWFRLGNDRQLRARADFDGHIWVAKTYADLGDEVRRSERQVKKAIKALRHKGYVIVERCQSRMYHGQVVSHFRLGWDRITEDLQEQGKGYDRGLL